LVALSLGGSAVAQNCAPTTVDGYVAVVHTAGSTAVGFFETNACDWGSASALNGTDGLVLSMAGMEGTTGTVTGTLVPGRSLLYVTFKGHFLDRNCKRVGNADLGFRASLEDAPESFPIEIPSNARWLAIDRVASNATTDVTITVHSDGRDCSVAATKKRKRR
jgi:hypothetical protein